MPPSTSKDADQLDAGNRTTQSTTSRIMKTTQRGRPYTKVSARPAGGGSVLQSTLLSERH